MRRRLTLVRRPDPLRAARRLRAVGVALLAVGVLAAGALYYNATQQQGPTMDELLPGLRAARSRQVGILYGRGVEALWDLYQDLKEPVPEAVLVAGAFALVAAGCFRAAWLHDFRNDMA